MLFQLIPSNLKIRRKRDNQCKVYDVYNAHQLKIGSKNRLKYNMKTVLIAFREQQKYCEVNCSIMFR